MTFIDGGSLTSHPFRTLDTAGVADEHIPQIGRNVVGDGVAPRRVVGVQPGALVGGVR